MAALGLKAAAACPLNPCVGPDELLDPVIHGEVDGPRRKIAEDGRPETAVQPTKAIVLDDVAKSACVVVVGGSPCPMKLCLGKQYVRAF